MSRCQPSVALYPLHPATDKPVSKKKGECQTTLIVRTSCFATLSEEGYDDDIVIQFNLANDTVEPLTWEAEDDFHYQFWGALRSYLERVESSDDLRAEFNSDRFQVESMDTGDILYSEYDSAEDGPWTREHARAAFMACVYQLTD